MLRAAPPRRCFRTQCARGLRAGRPAAAHRRRAARMYVRCELFENAQARRLPSAVRFRRKQRGRVSGVGAGCRCERRHPVKPTAGIRAKSFRRVRLQRRGHRTAHRIEDLIAEAQPHVALGGMNVRIDVFWRQLEKDDAVGVASRHRKGRVRCAPGGAHDRAAQQPPVDEEQLHAAVGPVRSWRADESREPAVERPCCGFVDGEQLTRSIASEDHREAFARVAGRGHRPNVLAVVAQRERDLRIAPARNSRATTRCVRTRPRPNAGTRVAPARFRRAARRERACLRVRRPARVRRPSRHVRARANPRRSWGSRETMSTCATAAIDANPSPRKPSVAIASRSDAAASLLVACRRTASERSAGAMPVPSSTTSTSRAPPCSIETATRRAPASMAFSTSSLTTDAGRSMISPAAI